LEDANRESRDLLIELKQQEKLTALHEKRANEKEDELKKQLDAFKEQFSRRLDEAKNDESLIVLEKQRQWELERQFLQSQLQYSQRQSEDSKRMHEALLTAINSKNASEGEEQIILINKNLSEAIAQVEARCQGFQAKVATLKPYKRALNQAESLQCANCQVFFKGLAFLDHCR